MSTDPRNIEGGLPSAARSPDLRGEPATGDLRDTSAGESRDRRESADAERGRAAVLHALRAEGLTIGECIRALAVPNADPYVSAARAAILADDDVEIDDETTTSVGDGGAWVLAWLWIGDEQAGVARNAEMLDAVLSRAREALRAAHGLDARTTRLRESQADWLEELLSNFADELDDIASTRPVREPGAVVWVDHGGSVRFLPSQAVLDLLGLARRTGLEARIAEQCERFCAQHGGTLDAALTVVQLR